jgi:mono/diheme cytochrome c family protein
MHPRGKELLAARLAVAAIVAFAACSRPLPEEGSAAAELYRRRCGSCHQAINPATMKYAMWKMVLPRMEERIRASREAPLGDEERRALESYLERNSEP